MTKLSKAQNNGVKSKRKRVVMRSLKINELSGVDRPAQEGAQALIMKRVEVPPQTEKGALLLVEAEGHSHLIIDTGHAGVMLNAGETSFQDGHDHPWVRDELGNVVVGVSTSSNDIPHTHSIGVISKDALITKGEPDMADKDTNIDELTKAKVKTDELEAQLATQKAYGSLTDTQKAYYNALDIDLEDDTRKAYLAKSAEGRQKVLDDIEVQKQLATDGKNVIYKSVDGSEYTASDDPRLVAQAKRNDELAKQLAETTAKNTKAEYEKRATNELKHIPGDLNTRIEMLKAIDGIEDETVRKAAITSLQAQNKQLSKAFTTSGVKSTNAAEDDETLPADKLDALAKSHAKENKVSFAKAYDDIIQTEEGARLYAQYTGDVELAATSH